MMKLFKGIILSCFIFIFTASTVHALKVAKYTFDYKYSSKARYISINDIYDINFSIYDYQKGTRCLKSVHMPNLICNEYSKEELANSYTGIVYVKPNKFAKRINKEPTYVANKFLKKHLGKITLEIKDENSIGHLIANIKVNGYDLADELVKNGYCEYLN